MAACSLPHPQTALAPTGDALNHGEMRTPRKLSGHPRGVRVDLVGRVPTRHVPSHPEVLNPRREMSPHETGS